MKRLLTVLLMTAALAAPVYADSANRLSDDEFYDVAMTNLSELSESLFASSEEGVALWEQVLSAPTRKYLAALKLEAEARYRISEVGTTLKVIQYIDKIQTEDAMVQEALDYKNIQASSPTASNESAAPAVTKVELTPDQFAPRAALGHWFLQYIAVKACYEAGDSFAGDDIDIIADYVQARVTESGLPKPIVDDLWNELDAHIQGSGFSARDVQCNKARLMVGHILIEAHRSSSPVTANPFN